MKRIDCVSSEGGPILIADAVIAQSWRGYEETANDDFMRGCEAVASSPGVVALPIGDGLGLVWDFGGAGTCDVFRDGDNIVLVRPWLEDCEQSEEDGIMLRFAEVPRKSDLALTEIYVTCGVLAVLWSPEGGNCVDNLDIGESERPNTDIMATDESGLLIRVANGRYRCFLDEFETPEGIARRCHLVAAMSLP